MYKLNKDLLKGFLSLHCFFVLRTLFICTWQHIAPSCNLINDSCVSSFRAVWDAPACGGTRRCLIRWDASSHVTVLPYCSASMMENRGSLLCEMAGGGDDLKTHDQNYKMTSIKPRVFAIFSFVESSFLFFDAVCFAL